MNWEELARRRESAIIKADAGLKPLWNRIQSAMWPHLDAIIGGMAVDNVGRMTFTLSNLQRAQRVGLRLSAVWKTTLSSVVMDYLIGSFRKLLGLNTDYVKAVTPNVTQTAEDRVLRRLLALYGYADGQVIPGTLFDALNPDKGLALEVSRKVQAAIAAKLPLEKFRAQMRKDFLHPTSGFMARYYRRWTNDLFMQFDRGVQMAYADEARLTHAVYAGTMKDTTRDFCESRLNRVYSRKEIASWNAKDWNGKHKDIPVELACGGYNCRHTLNYISEPMAEVIAATRGGINTYAEISQP